MSSILQLTSARGLNVVLVAEDNGCLTVCLTDGDGLRVKGVLTAWDRRRAGNFMLGDMSERSPRQEATKVERKPIPPREDEDGF